jgi:hypothetical protein
VPALCDLHHDSHRARLSTPPSVAMRHARLRLNGGCCWNQLFGPVISGTNHTWFAEQESATNLILRVTRTPY